MMKKIFQTEAGSISSLVARTLLAIVMFAHGAQKLFGIWGGYGFEGTMSYFTDSHGMPWIMGLAVILLESVGSVLLFFGVATRVIALGMIVILTSASIMVHLVNGFYLNWEGTQPGEGIEFFVLAIGLGIVSLINGGGKWSIDAYVTSRL